MIRIPNLVITHSSASLGDALAILTENRSSLTEPRAILAGSGVEEFLALLPSG